MDLHDISKKHLREFYEVKPIFDELGIEPTKDIFSDKPDIRFCFEGINIGLETTRCYPPDAKLHKNKYELGDNGVKAIVEKYRQYKKDRKQWVSLNIQFRNGLYYTLRNASLKKSEIEKITNEVIEEIETRIRRGHCNTYDTSEKERERLYYLNYKYTRSILFIDPQEGEVILGYGGEAISAKTIEHEPLITAISNKEDKLKEYRKLPQNINIDEYWLCINLPFASRRFFYDLDPIESDSGFSRIYITQFTQIQRIK